MPRVRVAYRASTRSRDRRAVESKRFARRPNPTQTGRTLHKHIKPYTNIMKVHLLPPDIISKIAAGEVIDRPASVIKELLENALDAGADSIEIELIQAGKSLIRLRDNGTGIAQDDIERIFERHSTSKIRTADDLFDIHSLGFRGEALYSICAVSDITVRSKTASGDSGWNIHMRGGKKLDLRPEAMPNGTEIEVQELFFNTPARRKFLKSNTSEMNQILGIVIPYTLLYPQCRFLLKHGNKTVFDLSKTGEIKQRAADILNLEQKFLIETHADFPEDAIAIRLIMGDINIIRSRRDMQFIFINGRPVQNKNISFHLNDVFRLILPPRHYPFFCAAITLPANEVDVNIHPTKREVKIREEQSACLRIRRLCENALMSASRPKQIREPDQKHEPGERPSVRKMIDQALYDREKDAAVLEKTIDDSLSPYPEITQQPLTEQYAFPRDDYPTEYAQHLFAQKQGSLKEKLQRARFIGSFLNTYLFFESERALLILDQHAAQERIMFEHFIKQMQDSRIEVQNLLAPYLLKASPQDLLHWQEAQTKLTEIGFDTTQFDDETIAIQSHPLLIKDPEGAVRELLANGDVARCDHETIARRACRSSVMAGDRLTKTQAEFQREQLLQCKDPFTCPHGRPTVIEVTDEFLNKQFLRT